MGVSFKDVGEFVKALIQLGGINSVDEDGYVISKDDEQTRVVIPAGKENKHLMVIKEIIKDDKAFVLNPMNETFADREDTRWLYGSLSVGLARRIIVLVNFIKNMKDLSDEDTEIEPAVIKLVSKYGTDMDDKFMKEFDIISKNYVDFINIFYNRKLKIAKLRCCVFEENTKSKYTSIRKKTWLILETLISDMLGLTSDEKEKELDEKFSFKSDLITCPKLHSMLNVYYRIYENINDKMLLIEDIDEDFVVDLTSLGSYIENIGLFYDKVKWFVQAGSTIKDEAPVSPLNTNMRSSLPENLNPIYQQPVSTLPVAVEPGFPMHMTAPNTMIPMAMEGGFAMGPQIGHSQYPVSPIGFNNMPMGMNGMGMNNGYNQNNPINFSGMMGSYPGTNFNGMSGGSSLPIALEPYNY